MTTYKTDELEGSLLDAAVAKAEGLQEFAIAEICRKKICQAVLTNGEGISYWADYCPSSDWAQGGPIIERERIGVLPSEHKSVPCWEAYYNAFEGYSCIEAQPSKAFAWGHPTVLHAAMVAYCLAKFGDEVDL